MKINWNVRLKNKNFWLELTFLVSNWNLGKQLIRSLYSSMYYLRSSFWSVSLTTLQPLGLAIVTVH